ncbi:MAG: cation:proton antiporter [Candidatus Omnitrophica bacterium]|nr:cation:proton antiporter [Candidatus Omnitrophota bacterium]
MEIFGFFLAAFITICLARPVATYLKIPTLIIYIIAGILFGSSGIGLVKDVSSINYFYELGIILLMFSAGLELKIQPTTKKAGKNFKDLLVFNLLIPSIVGLLYGLIIAKYFRVGSSILVSLYMITLFSSPASEVVIQFFREFYRKMDFTKKGFFNQIVFTSVLADLFSLFIFTIVLAIRLSKELLDIIKFFVFAGAFFFLVLKVLPVLHEKILKKLKGMKSSEDETTTILMLLVIVVSMGALLQIPPVVCSFFAGISLANIHINRMVRNNINFIASGIFVPIFFIIVGSRVNLTIFSQTENFILGFLTITILVISRGLSGYLVSRIEGFSYRDSIGFGFSIVPQLTGAIAISIVFFNSGMISEVLFNSVIILAIITTVLGTFIARLLLFPGLKGETKGLILIDDFYTDIKPFNLLTPICDIAKRLKYTELSVYPVTDNEGVYKGVIHLDDVRDTMFKEEIACLVISADVVDEKYPTIERDSTIQDVIRIFADSRIHSIPVVETVNGKPIYVGMILLQDILPEIQYIRS